jgi:transposase
MYSVNELIFIVIGRFYSCFSRPSQDPYDPQMLVALLFYGYATEVFSSRKLERSTYDSVAFRYLAANSHPDHDTIAAFRKRFLPQLTGIFVEILAIDHEMKVFSLGKVSIDGTRIKANASKHKALIYSHACKLQTPLEAEVAELLKIAESVDKATNDKRELEPALTNLKHLTQGLGTVTDIIAESGYFSKDNVRFCDENNVASFIAVDREKHHPQLMESLQASPPLPDNLNPVDTMRHRLKTKTGKAVYAIRKSTVEPVFGIIKSVMGFRQFMLRGLESVKREWNLVCIAYNLKKLYALAK